MYQLSLQSLRKKNKSIFKIWETFFEKLVLLVFIVVLIQLLFQFKNSNRWAVPLFVVLGYLENCLRVKQKKREDLSII